jgi:clathrin heavy chain
MYKDAIDTAAESKDADIAEDLLRFFVSVQDRGCFSTTLCTCYDLVRPDVAVELAWRNGYTDFSMPYMLVRRFHVLFDFVAQLFTVVHVVCFAAFST